MSVSRSCYSYEFDVWRIHSLNNWTSVTRYFHNNDYHYVCFGVLWQTPIVACMNLQNGAGHWEILILFNFSSQRYGLEMGSQDAGSLAIPSLSLLYVCVIF